MDLPGIFLFFVVVVVHIIDYEQPTFASFLPSGWGARNLHSEAGIEIARLAICSLGLLLVGDSICRPAPQDRFEWRAESHGPQENESPRDGLGGARDYDGRAAATAAAAADGRATIATAFAPAPTPRATPSSARHHLLRAGFGFGGPRAGRTRASVAPDQRAVAAAYFCFFFGLRRAVGAAYDGANDDALVDAFGGAHSRSKSEEPSDELGGAFRLRLCLLLLRW